MILPYRGMQTAVACPKCRYVRRPADTAPAWQCPSCGIAYAKFQAKRLVVPPKADEAAPPIAFDGSIPHQARPMNGCRCWDMARGTFR